jgi:hypothetical protein
MALASPEGFLGFLRGLFYCRGLPMSKKKKEFTIQKISRNKYLVDSDSGEQYKVAISGANKNFISCSCKGFVFRRACKHADAVKKILKKDGKIVKAQKLYEHFEFIESYKKSIAEIAKEVLK